MEHNAPPPPEGFSSVDMRPKITELKLRARRTIVLSPLFRPVNQALLEGAIESIPNLIYAHLDDDRMLHVAALWVVDAYVKLHFDAIHQESVGG